MPMIPLDPSTTGSVAETCTDIDFCTDVDFLGRPFHTYIYLDPCNNTGTIGIERFNLHLNLSDASLFSKILLYAVIYICCYHIFGITIVV
jgi:hypothetical protein